MEERRQSYEVELGTVTVVVVEVVAGAARFMFEAMLKQEQALETLAVSPEHWLAYVGVGIFIEVVYWLQNAAADEDLPRRARRQLSALHERNVVASGGAGLLLEQVVSYTVTVGKGSVGVVLEIWVDTIVVW